MAQVQTFQIEWEEHQTEPNEKHKQIGETKPNQKAIEWLETQILQKEWELHEKRGDSRQRAKNGEPIVVINHLNSSEHDIMTMVEQVLTTNEFSDDSSIFVVVPSVDNDAENSSHHLNPSVCMQMCEKPVQALKHKDNPVGRDVTPQWHRNSTANQGVKLSSKGKMFFMEGLTTDMLPYHNKEVLCDHHNPMPKDDWKKRTKNKLCQISTPNEIVEIVDNRCNVVGMDTTVDRPCCCSVKTNQLPNYNPNNRQVATVVSNVIIPHLETQGVTGTPFYMGRTTNPRESVRSATLPLASSNTPQSRSHRTQHDIGVIPQQFVRAPIQQLSCASTQQYARAYSQQYTKAPTQQLTCAPTRITWALDQQFSDSCPTQNWDMACPTQRCIEACPPQNRDMPYSAQRRTEACPNQNYDGAYPAHRRTEACPPQNYDESYPTQRRTEACPPQNYDGSYPTQRRTEVCPPQNYNGSYPTQRRTEACLPQNYDGSYPTQRHTEASSPKQHTDASSIQDKAERSTQEKAETCPLQHEACPTCQCSPEELLELFKLAVTGGKLHGIPICGVCPEPETLAPAPPAEPAPGKDDKTDLSCACETTSERMQVDTGATKQKPSSNIRQTRFIATVGTSTDDKPPRKSGWFSWRKSINICECPKAEAPKRLDYDPEPHLTLESYFKEKDSLILSAESLKKHSLETVRVSGFRLQQDKKPPPEPETDFTVEDAIRYLAMMNPDLFQDIVAEQQAKLDGTYKPPPPPPVEETPAPDTKAEDKEAFKGLKLKVGGKGSASKGLAGVCCFNLLTESFTTW